MTIWVTSDTHFLHKNCLKWENSERGKLFNNIQEMNETIIERWNCVVRKGDKVYHLGDVFIGDKDEFKSLWPRLNGKKRLIVGNHDDIKFLSSGGFFSKVYMWRIFKEFNCVLTHVPIDTQCFRRVGYNVHGHIHEKPSPSLHHHCVCVEKTNYTPINLEELAQRKFLNDSTYRR